MTIFSYYVGVSVRKEGRRWVEREGDGWRGRGWVEREGGGWRGKVKGSD